MQSKKLKQKVNSFVMASVMLASVMLPGLSVSAAQTSNVTLDNISLQEDQIDIIVDAVVENIEQNYADVYAFDNYDITIHNETEEDGMLGIDVDVLVDMTLIRNPQDSPYVSGMKAAVDEIEDAAEKEFAQQELDAYLEMVMPYYNVPVLTGFLYRVYIPTTMAMDAEGAFEFDMYHRMDITDEEVILSEVSDNETYTEIGDAEDGREHINEVLVSPLSTMAVSYSKSDAVDYAVEHAKDVPEYSAANNNGSDCANFVSKCVNAGGIPQDKSGNWYQGSTNWIRTGYNKNGGVVPYLTGKGYFAAVSSSSSATLGSIMYYNNKSHVAMVTLIDGYTIKYSHHSNVTKDSVYYVYNSSTDNVTFYVPQV